jgi:hypothetical protein
MTSLQASRHVIAARPTPISTIPSTMSVQRSLLGTTPGRSRQFFDAAPGITPLGSIPGCAVLSILEPCARMVRAGGCRPNPPRQSGAQSAEGTQPGAARVRGPNTECVRTHARPVVYRPKRSLLDSSHVGGCEYRRLAMLPHLRQSR